MRVTRRWLGASGGLALLALAVLAEPVAAQTSVNEELIFGLNRKLLYVAIPITVLVEGILFYTVYKYRNNDDPSPTQENRRLEITWTVATAIILLFVGLASYQVLGSAFIGGATAANPGDAEVTNLSEDYDGAQAPSEADAVEVEVVAAKYFWEVNYPQENVSGEQDTVVIPADRPVYIHVTSTDWLHAFHAPDLGLKQDAFPGEYNTIKTEVYEPGTYQLYCAEYCGVGHSQMLGTIEVLPGDEYDQWIEDQRSSGEAGGNETAGNETANATAGNETANATANGTAGNETTNATANATANGTDANATANGTS
ncbi:cytochrome c oxidase subunit II [Halomarina ordinaria]|uniref:cytochrome-c oxidase n=1 Tax=Halomarina ordinaria TaxID=3033939 RepID=A0ABD5U814_9EURY|nr:cytochrome c oxidase subunit II [Halomarina sp. PSRA2]